MAYLVQPDYVRYLCTCGQVKTITHLYFCRHCLKIRCGFCICHEVDSHYCANCLENMPSSEARLKKNRCSSCFNCPSCFHSLSTRATQVQPRVDAAGDAKVENKQTKKMYYLVCFNCRWTSRDVGIPDQPVASGGWPESPDPALGRFNQLLEYYKAAAAVEKQDKLDRERKKFNTRGKYITLTDKTGLSGSMARSLAGLCAPEPPRPTLAPSVATADVEPLSEDYWLKEPDLKAITSLPQRLAAPATQPALAAQLRPLPRPLGAKRAQRCRRCDHNLTKPEYSPGSVRFKIELLAVYHVPEVKIISCDALGAGGAGGAGAGAGVAALLKLTNPTGYEMTVRLLRPEDLPAGDESEKPPPPPACSWRVEAAPAPGSAPAGAPEPAPALSLAPRDDAAEYDEDAQPAAPAHPMVVWRKSNKMAIRVQVTYSPPQPDDQDNTDNSENAGSSDEKGNSENADNSGKPDSAEDPDKKGNPEKPGIPDNKLAILCLEYSYRNTVPPSASAPRAPHDHTLYATVLLDLGKIHVE